MGSDHMKLSNSGQEKGHFLLILDVLNRVSSCVLCKLGNILGINIITGVAVVKMEILRLIYTVDKGRRLKTQ